MPPTSRRARRSDNALAATRPFVSLLLAIALALTVAIDWPIAGTVGSTVVIAQDEEEGDAPVEEDRRANRRDRQAEAEPTEDFDCIDFETQEEAQAVLDEDPDDPYNLDPNDDGFACALLPSEEELADENEPTRGNRRGQDRDDTGQDEELVSNCVDYTQEEAQEILDDEPRDPENLDPDGDGIACEAEELDGRVRPEDPVEVVDPKRDAALPEDLDCADFTFQEEAQLVFDNVPGDPYNLDPNGDGFACSSLPSSTRTVRISGVPTTGVGPRGATAPTGATAALLGVAVVAGGLSMRPSSTPR